MFLFWLKLCIYVGHWESCWECTVVAFVTKATMFGFGKNRVECQNLWNSALPQPAALKILQHKNKHMGSQYTYIFITLETAGCGGAFEHCNIWTALQAEDTTKGFNWSCYHSVFEPLVRSLPGHLASGLAKWRWCRRQAHGQRMSATRDVPGRRDCTSPGRLRVGRNAISPKKKT